MPDMHLRQPGFACSAFEPFIKKRKKNNLKKYMIQDIFIKTK